MQLARVIGTVVATVKSPGLEGVKLLVVQPLDRDRQPTGSPVVAADAGLKGARVRLLELRLADGLGGKGYLLFDGSVSDVEAAVEAARTRIAATPRTTHRVIAQLHAEMRDNLEAAARFGERVRAPSPPPGAAEPAVARPSPARRRTRKA